jgi:hypothetical protein
MSIASEDHRSGTAGAGGKVAVPGVLDRSEKNAPHERGPSLGGIVSGRDGSAIADSHARCGCQNTTVTAFVFRADGPRSLGRSLGCVQAGVGGLEEPRPATYVIGVRRRAGGAKRGSFRRNGHAHAPYGRSGTGIHCRLGTRADPAHAFLCVCHECDYRLCQSGERSKSLLFRDQPHQPMLLRYQFSILLCDHTARITSLQHKSESRFAGRQQPQRRAGKGTN